jgi:altronate dehydratase small subunit
MKTGGEKLAIPALVIHPDDNVATALRPLAAGEVIGVAVGGQEMLVKLLQPVPFGHKFALCDIPAGANVTKYGEKIGLATVAIARGEHVHTHNVEGSRGRGDLK